MPAAWAQAAEGRVQPESCQEVSPFHEAYRKREARESKHCELRVIKRQDVGDASPWTADTRMRSLERHFRRNRGPRPAGRSVIHRRRIRTAGTRREDRIG